MFNIRCSTVHIEKKINIALVSFDVFRLKTVSNEKYNCVHYPIRYRRPMKKLFVVLYVFLSSSAFAQDSTVYFYDEQGELTVEPRDAFSYRISIPKGEHLYIRHYLVSNDYLLLEGTFLRLGRTLINDGPYKSFYENGKTESEGNYAKDRRVGLWKTYYSNGQQADEEFYQPGKIMYHQHWDSVGNPSLTNGTGKFIAGAQHIEVIDSLLFSLFSIDSLSSDSIYTVVEKKADYIGGMNEFYADVKKDLNYPKLARQYLVAGRVFVEFVIDKTGKMHDAKVTSGIGGGCDEAALEAVKKRIKWIPGKIRGKAVSQRMSLPIDFNLKD